MSRPSEHELRCFCRTTPLLATYGLDAKRKLFVHVKIWKQSRIYGELLFSGGVVKIRCRNCFRWHRIIFRENSAELSEEKSASDEVSVPASPVLDAPEHD